jgi:hypothetical protein
VLVVQPQPLVHLQYSHQLLLLVVLRVEITTLMAHQVTALAVVLAVTLVRQEMVELR